MLAIEQGRSVRFRQTAELVLQPGSMVELERAARREPGLGNLSRETVRRMLKKTISSPGGG